MKKINLTVLLLLHALFFIQTNLNAQTLTTDKPDYPPLDTATMYGTGFWPNETVTLKVSELIYGVPGPTDQWDVVADSLGNFVTTWHVCNCPFDSLLGTASGNASSNYAEVRFTDAPRTDVYPLSFSTFSATATYCQGAAASNLTAAWTNTTCTVVTSGPTTNVNTVITWYKNSSNLTSGGTAVQTTSTTAATTSSTYTPPTNVTGTLYYYVTVSWSAGPNCAAAGSITTTSTKTVVVNSTPATPTVSAGGPTTFCQGGSVVLTSSSATGNQWYKSGSAISGETNQTLTVTTSGSYSVIVTSGSCSSAASTPINVTVNPNPTAGVGIFAPNPSVICSGSSTTVKFSGTANASVSYNKNGTLQSPITLNNGGVFSLITGPLTSTTVYEIVSVTSSGCTSTTGFSPANVTVTVNQPPVVTSDPSNQTVTYGAPASFTVAATGTGLIYQWQVDAGSGFTNVTNTANLYSGATTATLNVERPTVAMNNYSYRAIVSGVCAPTATSSAAVLSVNKASLTVTADNKTKVYGDPDPTLTFTPSGTLYYGDSYSVISGVILTTATGSVATVGTHSIVPSSGTAANYSIQNVNGTLTVSSRPITVAANPQSKVYGSLDPSLTYTITSGSLAYSDVFAGSLQRTAGENIGKYAINQGSLDNTNYNITYTRDSLTITPLSVSVTADPKTKVYGSVDPALTFISSPAVGSALANGDLIAFTGSLQRIAGENVGKYAINQGNLNNTNYNISYTLDSLTITPLSVSVTADPKTKVYGSVDPSLTYVSNPAVGSALANGDLISFIGSLQRVAGEDVGKYLINQGTLNNTNYNITYTADTLTITKLPVSVTADPKTKVYGSVDPALTYTSNPAVGSALANGDLISFTGALQRVAGEDVGKYLINQGSLNNTNYNITYTADTLNITKLPVSVTADAKTKVYGSEDPSLTYVSNPAVGSALANGDLISFTGALQRVAGEDVGKYLINQGSLNNTNYNITYTADTLIITKLPVSVTANPKTKVYGSVDPALTYTSNPAVGSALANGDLISFTGALQRVAGENIGKYLINQGSLNNTNYNITYTADTLTITKLPVSVTANPKTKVYGSVDPALTYTSNPAVGSALANGDLISFTGALQRTAGENVGKYSINQGSLNNTNYCISYTRDSLTITKLPVSVTAAAKTKVYGAVDPPLTYTSNPAVGSTLANGDLISFTGSLQRVAGENVGTYAINQGSLNNTNYTISYTSATLTITPLSVTVTANPKTKTYGSVDPPLTFSSNPAVGSALANGQLISFTGSLQRVAGESVGTYAINQGTVGNTNYSITYVGANFVITQAIVLSCVKVTPNPQQYSDLATYCAVIKGGAPLITGGPQAAQSVTFKVGTQTIATNVPLVVSGSDIVATYSTGLLEPSPYGTLPTGQMAPGTHTITAEINGANSNYSVTPIQPTTTLTITKENDPVYYTGEEFASTGSATGTTAKIHLSASLTDDPDGYPGDIRNARVRFKIQPYNCDISMTPQPIVYTSWRTVALINPAVTTIGTAYLDTTFDIGSCDAKIYDVNVEVSGYYTGVSDVVTITVAKTMADFISGGGHLDIGAGIANKSSGPYKSSDNSKTNFGFTVKYNKNKTNLQGNVNVIIRSNGKVYQVKGIVGGSNGSLNTNTSDPTNKKAALIAKANMIDVATGLLVNYGSNGTLELKISDKGEPGANIDTYGLTVWGSNGSLLYSSNWSTATNSTNEVVINGGNIQVGSSTTAGKFASTNDSLTYLPYTVKIFPNPTDNQRINISIQSGTEQVKTAQLYIYDISGKLMHADDHFCTQNCSDATFDLDTRFVSGIYLMDIVVDGRIYHQKLIVK